jgi:hypothetical protein
MPGVLGYMALYVCVYERVIEERRKGNMSYQAINEKKVKPKDEDPGL